MKNIQSAEGAVSLGRKVAKKGALGVRKKALNDKSKSGSKKRNLLSVKPLSHHLSKKVTKEKLNVLTSDTMEEGFHGGYIKEQSDKKDPEKKFDITMKGFLHYHRKCIKEVEDRVQCSGEFDIMDPQYDIMEEGFLHDHGKCITKAEGLEIEAADPHPRLISPIKFPDWKWDDKFWPRIKRRDITLQLFGLLSKENRRQ